MAQRGKAKRKAGRPRSETARQAILEATVETVAHHGLAGSTIEAIARRARVSKATIYRWWPGRTELIFDAYLTVASRALPIDSDTGSLEGDLLARLVGASEAYSAGGVARTIWALALEIPPGSQLHRKYVESFVKPARADHRRAFERARKRGEIAADADIDLALDMLHGALSMRMVHGHLPVDDRVVATVVSLVVRGLTATQGGGRRSARSSTRQPR